MYISEVVDLYQLKEKEIYVKAIAEDYKLIRHQTLYDPAEYGPAYVETYISKLDLESYYDQDIPESELETFAKQYLQELDYDLDWRVIENDY